MFAESLPAARMIWKSESDSNDISKDCFSNLLFQFGIGKANWNGSKQNSIGILKVRRHSAWNGRLFQRDS